MGRGGNNFEGRERLLAGAVAERCVLGFGRVCAEL